MSYVRAIPFVLALCFLVWALIATNGKQRAEHDLANITGERDIALAANEYLRANIERLEAINKGNDALILDNAQVTAVIMHNVTKMRDDVAKIKAASDAIQTYLTGVVPADIQRLLNRPETGNQN